MGKIPPSLLFTLYFLKYTGTFFFDLSSNGEQLVQLSAAKQKIAALTLFMSNFGYLGTTYKKCFAEKSHSGETLVRCVSDLTYNFLVLFLTIFIIKCSRRVTQMLNHILSLEIIPDVHFSTPYVCLLYEVIVAVLNFVSYSLNETIFVAFLPTATDVFVISIGVQVIFVHHLLGQSFKQLNLMIKETAKISPESVFRLRNLRSEIVAIFEEMQKIFGFMILVLIADHGLYVQIDAHYFISTIYDLSVGVKTSGKVLFENFVVYTAWATLDFLVVLLIILVCSTAETEVRLKLFPGKSENILCYVCLLAMCNYLSAEKFTIPAPIFNII